MSCCFECASHRTESYIERCDALLLHPAARVQVRYNEASGAVLSAAAKLGGGRAQPALQLVGYEGEVEAAVKYAFGSAFVCQVRSWGLGFDGGRAWGLRLGM